MTDERWNEVYDVIAAFVKNDKRVVPQVLKIRGYEMCDLVHDLTLDIVSYMRFNDEELAHYDPEKGTFSAYLQRMVRNRLLDEIGYQYKRYAKRHPGKERQRPGQYKRWQDYQDQQKADNVDAVPYIEDQNSEYGFMTDFSAMLHGVTPLSEAPEDIMICREIQSIADKHLTEDDKEVLMDGKTIRQKAGELSVPTMTYHYQLTKHIESMRRDLRAAGYEV